jgi:hypothetical protein
MDKNGQIFDTFDPFSFKIFIKTIHNQSFCLQYFGMLPSDSIGVYAGCVDQWLRHYLKMFLLVLKFLIMQQSLDRFIHLH